MSMPDPIRLGYRRMREDLMKTKIGEMAGRLWRILGEREEVAVSNLPRILKEKGEIVYQALGWLAKEDKIEFRKKEGKIHVSLSHEEQEIFKKAL
jgi:hypothetical protein